MEWPWSLGDETSGLGLTLLRVDTDVTPDVLVAWVDNPGGENAIRYRVGWDLDASGGLGGDWSPIFTVPGWVGADSFGLGITNTYISPDSNHDLVLFWVDGSGNAYYKIGWDLQTTGAVSSWSAERLIFGGGQPAFGAAIRFGGFDENSILDAIMVVGTPWSTGGNLYSWATFRIASTLYFFMVF